eukprot:56135-Heterocapsa_arctica.AAC.1
MVPFFQHAWNVLLKHVQIMRLTKMHQNRNMSCFGRVKGAKFGFTSAAERRSCPIKPPPRDANIR